MSLARQILLDSPAAFWPLNEGPSAGPENITGIVAAWVADDIAQTNGSAVSSWTDRVSGKVLAQATGATRRTAHYQAGRREGAVFG